MIDQQTISVPEAGQILGIGRNQAYDAARRGEIPVLKFGRLLRVSIIQLNRLLEGEAPATDPETGDDSQNGK